MENLNEGKDNEEEKIGKDYKEENGELESRKG